MNPNILTSVKKALVGVTEDDTAFDDQILLHINSVIPTLHQLGVGSMDGFVVDENSLWDDFVENKILQSYVSEYVVNKVKLVFDPPSSSFVLASLEKQTAELEWRITVLTDEMDKKNVDY